MENSKYQPVIVNSDKWEGADDTISDVVGLALAYKSTGQLEEIDALWDGAVGHMLLGAIAGVDMDDFIYAFEVAA